MKFTPLNDRLLVSRTDSEETSAGGIIIPDTAKEKPLQANVIAVGEGKPNKNGGREPIGVEAGDVVLFGKYSGTEIKLDGEDFLILRADDVLAVVEL
jgi:chaperonin GroES